MGRVGGRTKSRNFDITEQQMKFCENYLSNGNNGKAAALAAGYSEKSAYQSAYNLMKMPAVNNYIAARKNEVEEKEQLTFNYKIKKLKTVIELAIPEGSNDISQIKASDGISAIAESNKMQGHYSAEKHINANININTDSDLNELYNTATSIDQKFIREY